MGINSLTKRKRLSASYAELVKKLPQLTSSTATASSTFDMEALASDEDAMGEISHFSDSIIEAGKQVAGLDVDLESIHIDALTSVAAMKQDSAAYAKAYSSYIPNAGEGNVQLALMTATGDASTFDMEAYSVQQMENSSVMNVRFAIKSTKQLDFAEKFYPTTVVPANPMGIQLNLPVTEVIRKDKHITASGVDLENVRLSDALFDTGVFGNAARKLVPYVDTKNNGVLAGFGETVKQVAGNSITTRPLKPGVQINLLTVSAHPDLVGNAVLTTRDEIDRVLSLEALYVTVGGTTTAAADVSGQFKFSTNGSSAAYFTPIMNGKVGEMSLNYSSVVRLDADKINAGVTGASDAFAGLSTNTVELQLNFSAIVDIAKGTMQPATVNAVVRQVYDVNGDVVVDDTAVAAATDALTVLAIQGFDLDANRTNDNLRTEGRRLETATYKLNLPVQFTTQLMVASPSGRTSDLTVEDLVSAFQLDASSRAVKQLETYYDRVFANDGMSVSPLELGAGAAYMRTAAKSIEIDLANIQTIESSNRAEDARNYTLGRLRDAAFEVLGRSGLKSAFENLGGGEVTAIVGTSTRLGGHIMVTGDERTLGAQLPMVLTTTDYTELQPAANEAYIYVAFTDLKADVGPMQFGSHLYMIPAVYNGAVGRGGQTSNELIVTPRSSHVNSIPVMVRAHVKNIDKITGIDL